MPSVVPLLQAYRLDLATLPPECVHDESSWLQLGSALEQLGRLRGEDRAAYLRQAVARWCPEPAEAADAETRLLEATRELCERMEEAGAFQLAFAVLRVAIDALPGAAPRSRGLARAQQGRIVRQTGALARARDLYELAAAIGHRHGIPEVVGRATIGCGVLAQLRGNFPEARATFERALEVAPDVPGITVMAHHSLMVLATARGDFDEALAHGWYAFRDVAGDADRRADALTNLAEVARLAGYPDAALRGYRAALALTRLARVRLAALGGGALAAAAAGDPAALAEITATAEREMTTSAQAYENARTSVELAEAHARLGHATEAERYRGRALQLGRAGGFHEVTVRADRLRVFVPAPESAPSRPVLESIGVIRNLAGLPLDEAALALVG